MTTIVTHYTFWHTGCSGSVENIKRVGRFDRYTVDRVDSLDYICPAEVTSWLKLCSYTVTLKNDAFFRFVIRLLYSIIDQRFVGQGFFALNGARGNNDCLGLCMVNADGKFMGCKSAKDDRVYSAEPGTGQHGDSGFGDHRHIDNDRVTFVYPLSTQCTCECCNLFLELFVRDFSDSIGDRAVINYGGLVSPATENMPVNSIVAGVHFSTAKPAVERRVGLVKYRVPFFYPVNVFGSFCPKAFRIFDTLSKSFFVSSHVLYSICIRLLEKLYT